MKTKIFLILAVAVYLFASETMAQESVKVHTEGLTAKIKFESVLSGYLTELNGKYKLRVTELILQPGGQVGEHNHVGPGIRLVTTGSMTYVLPDKTVVYGPGDYFFESGDVNHTASNKTDAPHGPPAFRDSSRRTKRAILDSAKEQVDKALTPLITAPIFNPHKP